MKIITGVCLILFATLCTNAKEETKIIKDDFHILSSKDSLSENTTKVSNYLKEKKNLKGKLKKWDTIDNTLAIFYQVSSPGVPSNEVIVAVADAPDDKSKEVFIALEYKLPESLKTKAARYQMMRLINYWIFYDEYPFSVTLKKDELFFVAMIELKPGTVVSTEIITDLALRLMKDWPAKYKDMKKYIKPATKEGKQSKEQTTSEKQTQGSN